MAVSHVLSNAVPDATGTMTIWFGATTATVAATDVIRPSDWNSAHNQYMTVAGNTVGQSTFSGTNIVIGGGANITLSGVNATRFDIVGGAGGGGGSVNISAGTTSNNLTALTFADGNGVSFGLNGSTITATVATNYLTSQSNQNITAANGGFAFQTLSFSNANGVSFGTSAGSAITASVQTSYRASNDAIGLNTAQSNVTWTVNSNGLSLDARGYAGTNTTFNGANLSGSMTVNSNGVQLSLSAGNYLTSQSNQAFSAAGGSSAFQTLGFSDTNGVSFSNSNGSVVATVRTDYASSVHGHTATLLATSNTTQSSSGTANLNNLIFAGAGIASVGVTNGSVVVSVPAGGGAGDGGVFAGVSNLGNTAGSTGTVSTGNFVLVGSQGITLSQSTAAAGSHATITILGPQSTLSQFVGVPFAGKGAPPQFAQSSSSLGQNSLYIYPVQMEDFYSFDHVKFPVMMTNSSSGAASVQKGLTIRFGIYTRNATNQTVLTQHYSTSYTLAASHNSNASWMLSLITAIGNSTSYNTLSASSAGLNLSSSLHGPRELIAPISSVLPPGEYWLAVHHSTSSAGAGGNLINMSNICVALQTFNRPGIATNSSNDAFHRQAGMGVYSATTAALPGGISITQINNGGTQPMLFFATGTV